jgi:hypothetical protein
VGVHAYLGFVGGCEEFAMNHWKILLGSCWGMLSIFLLSSAVSGTQIDPWTWEQLALNADLIGVVECTTAGGIVARYRVLDVWKGTAPDREIAIRTETDYWGEAQYSMVLCGERRVVFLFEGRAETRMVGMTGRALVPLWWRRIPSDYRLPLFQGVWPISDDEKGSFRLESWSEPVTLPEFKKLVMDFLDAGVEQKELQLLKSLTMKYMIRSIRSLRLRPERDAIIGEYAEQLKRADDPVRVLEMIPQIVPEIRRDDAFMAAGRVQRLLQQAPGQAALHFAETVDPAAIGLTRQQLDQLVETMREKRRADAAGRIAAQEMASWDGRGVGGSKPVFAVPSDRELSDWRRILSGGMVADNPKFVAAFEILTAHDPAFACNYLCSWTNPAEDCRGIAAGYPLASYFCWLCPRDRQGFFARLLSARDNDVKVAAAVYLCFEDLEAGLAALRRYTSLPGHAGHWAALTLVRRGSSEHMPRALEILREVPPSHMPGIPHRNLQKRLIELLSNSARQSSLPLTPVTLPPSGADLANAAQTYQGIYQSYAAWWKQYGDRVSLADPWMPVLEKQKVD